MATDNAHPVTEDWRPWFGHAEPYDEQVDGIETAIEVARDGGFLAVEGACGTGKTMLALTAGIHLVRDPDSRYERVVVLTSVKQQLRQFEDDLRAINEDLPEDQAPVSGLTLVGKADVCPYNREQAGGIDDGNVYDRCEALRERTRNLTEAVPAGTLAGEARVHTGQAGTPAATGADATTIETADEAAPYPRTMPSQPTDGGDVEYCPFYAEYLANAPADGDPLEAVPFDVDAAGLIATEDLVGRSAAAGTCPHSVMGALLEGVEVVVGNYYHGFDPQTVTSFTGPLLADTTFLVCDEAHMLEPRVRDLVSDGVADETLGRARAELARVVRPLELDGEDGELAPEAAAAAETARTIIAQTGVTVEDLSRLDAFLEDLRAELDRRVTKFLDDEHPGWRSALADLPDTTIPLRDPEAPAPDGLTEWARESGAAEGVWAHIETIAAVVDGILEEIEGDAPGDDGDERRRALPAVARVLAAWRQADHVRYYRELELDRTWDRTADADTWRRAYTVRLALHNCVPGEVIGQQLAAFGGGVLMSATLEPMDVFREVTGLDHLAEAGRPVRERRFGLSFPAANRGSFAVAAPKYTHANRGSPGEETPVRVTYARLVAEVAGRDGNVLVGMPNYAEAEWMAGALRNRVTKPVLLDESTDDAATESLKDDFFAGDGKVLVTSLRGTLTEGVDYRGDRLTAAVVCGVPIVNTAEARTRAVRTAYDRTFGDGFRYALAVPAVRKARQAVGRVIRGPAERGVRVLLDERYAREGWDSVRDLLPPEEREEFSPVSPDMLSHGLDRFDG